MTNQELFILLTSGASLLSALLGAGIAMGMFKQKVTATAKDLEKLETRVDAHDINGFPFCKAHKDAIDANSKRIDGIYARLDPLSNDVAEIKGLMKWWVKEYKTKNGGE